MLRLRSQVKQMTRNAMNHLGYLEVSLFSTYWIFAKNVTNVSSESLTEQLSQK